MCSNQPAYVFKDDEFNRDSPNFNKEPTDRDSVQICYSNRSTTVDELLQLAEKECAIYGKTARFQFHEFFQCPLTTPARATFLCLRR